MSKGVKFIGTTPHNLTRAANDMALKKFAENNRRLLKAVSKIHSNITPEPQKLMNK